MLAWSGPTGPTVARGRAAPHDRWLEGARRACPAACTRARAPQVDVLDDPSGYAQHGRYCDEIVRVRPGDLYAIREPGNVALLFVWGRSLPWRAYLSRYATAVPLVVIVGDPQTDGYTEPGALALDGVVGWRLLSREPVRARLPEAATAVYCRDEAQVAGRVDTWFAETERPRMAPGYRVNMSPEHVMKHGLPFC